VDEVARYLREEHPQVAELAAWVRTCVLGADPDLTERVYRGWRGIGYRHPDAGYVCAIFPRSDRDELLFEHGASMADPDGVLQGEGSQTRFIDIDARSDETAGLVERYVQQAVAERLLARGT
jgi:hypothetical protein